MIALRVCLAVSVGLAFGGGCALLGWYLGRCSNAQRVLEIPRLLGEGDGYIRVEHGPRYHAYEEWTVGDKAYVHAARGEFFVTDCTEAEEQVVLGGQWLPHYGWRLPRVGDKVVRIVMQPHGEASRDG